MQPPRVRKKRKKRNERKVELRSLENRRKALELLGMERGLTKSQIRAARELFKRGCTFQERPRIMCHMSRPELLKHVPGFACERYDTGLAMRQIEIPPEMWIEAAGWIKKAKKPIGNAFDNMVRENLKPSFLKDDL
jgi:hypothetical protein